MYIYMYCIYRGIGIQEDGYGGNLFRKHYKYTDDIIL
jgi:hypothetical protein